MEQRSVADVGPGDPTTQLLVDALYSDLRRLAHRERRRVGASETMRTTALVHEAYLKLYQGGQWRGRAPLFWCAAGDPRLARVVECRYFAGYTEAETAAALQVTERTVQRDWAKAKALLYEALGAS